MTNPVQDGVIENNCAGQFRLNYTPDNAKNQALALAGLGFSVFPCNADKTPASLNGFHDATTDLTEVERLFNNAKNAVCVGIATGGKSNIAALDIDFKNGAHEWWGKNKHFLSLSYSYQTPSGGYHIIFKNQQRLRCSQGKIAKGIDVRADGGYIVYHPANGYPVLNNAPFAEWPQGLSSKLDIADIFRDLPLSNVTPAYIEAALNNAVYNVSNAPEGERNSTLNKEAHGLFRLASYIPASKIISYLTQAAIFCGLDDREIKRTIESAAKARGIDLNNPPLVKQDSRLNFNFTRADQLKQVRQAFIVDQIIQEHSLSMMFGPSGGGKTFGALDIGFCIAAGIAWHGHLVKKGAVLYICGEGKSGILKRLKALSAHYGVALDGLDFYVSSGAADFCDSSSLNAVNAAIVELNISPSLIIIDTLSRNNSADENDTAAMAAFIKAIDMIKDAYQASILLVHHTGHSEKERARGSSVIKAALDSEYRFDKKDNQITFTCTKMKDSEECKPKTFELRQIPIDIGGFPESGAVLISQSSPRSKLSPQTERAFDLLKAQKTPINYQIFKTILEDNGVINAKPENTDRIIKRILDEISDKMGLSEVNEYLYQSDKSDNPRTKAGQDGHRIDDTLPFTDRQDSTPRGLSECPKGDSDG